MSRGARRAIPLDLLAVLLGGALLVFAVFALPGVVGLRAAVGVPFLILGPGYAITSALFPLEPPELSMRVALSLGLSIASVVLAGLALNAARIELTVHALAVALLVVAAAGCAIAAFRRDGQAVPVGLPGTAALRSPWLGRSRSCLPSSGRCWCCSPIPCRIGPSPATHSSPRCAWSPRGSASRCAAQNTPPPPSGLVATTASGRRVSREFRLAPAQEWAGILPTGRPRDQTIHIRLYRAREPGVVYREVVPRA